MGVHGDVYVCELVSMHMCVHNDMPVFTSGVYMVVCLCVELSIHMCVFIFVYLCVGKHAHCG